MTHLTSDELIDAMEGMLAAERQAHLTTCEECQRQLADLSVALSGARQVNVPEPSPLFWQHFSQRVRVAIEAEPVVSGWQGWSRWQVLAPLGAVALLVFALVLAVPRPEPGVLKIADEQATGVETPAEDSWVMLADLVGPLDMETATAAGVIELGVAEQAVLELTSEEQQELTRLLRAELQRAKS